MPRLRRSSCATPGIRRRRRGRGSEYLSPEGRRIEDRETLERIEGLAIPPAWRDVWICTDPLGHLQATGVDAAGRRQYRYHDRWRAHRDRLKFDSMLSFGASLPRIRRRVGRDLRAEELSRRQVLACAVRLLDLGFFRIGSEGYAERNGSYGLTTMRVRHVSLDGRRVIFDYNAKSGVHRIQAIADEDVLAIVRRLLDGRRGSERLLVWSEDGAPRPVRSEDVNEYVREASGGDFTAKDFRTWNATVLAAVALAARAVEATSAAARKRGLRAAVRTVAEYLGNTPAVCRSSYIDPRLIDRYMDGETIAPAIGSLRRGPDLDDPRTRARVEKAVLELLDEGS